jgi:ubiquinone/menaquinone biosynthesis C-methylase UbiE
MRKEEKITLEYYKHNPLQEWRRLVKDPFHRLEFDTTMKFLKKHLPKNKKGLILDAGGGPGRYTIELAKMGYNLILLDLVPENLEFAKKKIAQAGVENKVKDIVAGTVTDLAMFESNTFDAVLCLGGVLSHIGPRKEREKAAIELVRVAKKGAPIFVSVMSKLGTLAHFPRWIDEIRNTSHFERIYSKGDDYQWHGKYYAHYFELNELKSLFGNKVVFIEEVGLEGLASQIPEIINKLAKKEPIAWENWLKMHHKLCTHPAVVELSLHFMVIARKV